MEKVLPYDRTIVRQETGYWCGPASTQIVLDSLGIHIPESQLAREIGTHTGGTDHIGLITPILNKYSDAGYFAVQMPSDPPTAAQTDRLWADISASINGGRGVVANIVAPPPNYPKAVAPSTISPAYSGGDVYHYVAVMGYSDDGPRRVWIADSGFAPYGYWCSFDQLASLIPPKGYAAAPGPTAPAPVAPPEGLTAETLAAAMDNAVSLDRYRELLPGFAESMRQADCTTPLRAAMWCAQIGHESGGLRYMEEIASGDAYDTRTDLGNTPQVDGDGRLFKGSGPIQLTGRTNFRAFSAWCHAKGWVDSPTYFEQHPQLVREDPRWGFLAASWYWTVSRPQINALADRQDLDAVTRAINGGLNGIGDRRERYARCLQLGAALLPRETGAVAAIAAEAAGAAVWLGERTAEGDAADGGRFVHYTGGSIYWHPTTGAYAIPAALCEKYAQLGWERSYVGYPIERHLVLHEPEFSGEAWGDVQGFHGGAIYRRYGHPGHVVTGLIRAYWHSAGSETGRFGWPVSDEQWADRDGGIRFQDFEHGRITWSATGTIATHAEPGFDAITTEEN